MHSIDHSSLLDSVEEAKNLKILFSGFRELRFLFESAWEIHHLFKGTERDEIKNKTISTLGFGMRCT